MKQMNLVLNYRKYGVVIRGELKMEEQQLVLYSKKRLIKPILAIFIFSIIIMLLDISNGYIKGHDTDFHFPAITAIVEQLSWDNLFVQEPLKYIGNNFGYGTRLFYPPLPHLVAAYITKMLTIFGINNVAIGMRITQWLTFFLSGVTFYLLSTKLFKNKKISVILACFYMTAPYHLSEIFVRDAFSEMFIPIAIPLIVLGLLNLVEKNYKKFFLYFIGGYVIAIFSHLAMTIYFTIIILVTFFTVYFKEIFTRKNILCLVIASIGVLLATASFWMPLLEIKIKGSYGIFMPYYITEKGGLAYSTISIKELFAFDREIDFHYIRFNLQFVVTIMFFISLIYILKAKLFKEKWVRFLLVFTLISVIMVTSIFPWKYTPDILQTLQFPWRLALYILFGSILFSGIFLKHFECKKYFNIICCILVCFALLETYINIDHLEEEQIDLSNLNNSKCMGNQLEYLPENALNNIDYFNNRSDEIIFLSGSGEANIITNDVPYLKFEVNTNEIVTIELPRIYYMGYKLTINDEEVKLSESDNGFLQATISKNGTYELTYSGTKVMQIANVISVWSFLMIGYILIV